jgi:shikimate kinase
MAAGVMPCITKTDAMLKQGMNSNEANERKRIIFLIGMPGAGKTYWGGQIAAAYGLDFVDLDKYTSEQEKASVQAIFASYGEAGFREREHKCLVRLIRHLTAGTVVACGGGTPVYQHNMQLMLNSGVVVYLKARTDLLVRRLKNSDEVRPLLRGKPDVGAYLDALMEVRGSIYERASYILDANSISVVTFAEIVDLCINQH